MKQTVPNITFKTRVRDESVEGPNPFRWQDVTSSEIFDGKTVVVFALPGAFTPTCSSTHLPGFEEKYEELKALGVDEVYCLSVNDAFTMYQWGQHQGVEKTLLGECQDVFGQAGAPRPMDLEWAKDGSDGERPIKVCKIQSHDATPCFGGGGVWRSSRRPSASATTPR